MPRIYNPSEIKCENPIAKMIQFVELNYNEEDKGDVLRDIRRGVIVGIHVQDGYVSFEERLTGSEERRAGG